MSDVILIPRLSLLWLQAWSCWCSSCWSPLLPCTVALEEPHVSQGQSWSLLVRCAACQQPLQSALHPHRMHSGMVHTAAVATFGVCGLCFYVFATLAVCVAGMRCKEAAAAKLQLLLQLLQRLGGLELPAVADSHEADPGKHNSRQRNRCESGIACACWAFYQPASQLLARQQRSSCVTGLCSRRIVRGADDQALTASPLLRLLSSYKQPCLSQTCVGVW